MKIQVLGTGCDKCNQLADSAEAAASELNLDFQLEKVTDVTDIIMFGVTVTPALVVNGQIKVIGKVPSVDEIKAILSEA